MAQTTTPVGDVLAQTTTTVGDVLAQATPTVGDVLAQTTPIVGDQLPSRGHHAEVTLSSPHPPPPVPTAALNLPPCQVQAESRQLWYLRAMLEDAHDSEVIHDDDDDDDDSEVVVTSTPTTPTDEQQTVIEQSDSSLATAVNIAAAAQTSSSNVQHRKDTDTTALLPSAPTKSLEICAEEQQGQSVPCQYKVVQPQKGTQESHGLQEQAPTQRHDTGISGSDACSESLPESQKSENLSSQTSKILGPSEQIPSGIVSRAPVQSEQIHNIQSCQSEQSHRAQPENQSAPTLGSSCGLSQDRSKTVLSECTQALAQKMQAPTEVVQIKDQIQTISPNVQAQSRPDLNVQAQDGAVEAQITSLGDFPHDASNKDMQAQNQIKKTIESPLSEVPMHSSDRQIKCVAASATSGSSAATTDQLHRVPSVRRQAYRDAIAKRHEQQRQEQQLIEQQQQQQQSQQRQVNNCMSLLYRCSLITLWSSSLKIKHRICVGFGQTRSLKWFGHNLRNLKLRREDALNREK